VNRRETFGEDFFQALNVKEAERVSWAICACLLKWHETDT
jgi:hypothetical protein